MRKQGAIFHGRGRKEENKEKSRGRLEKAISVLPSKMMTFTGSSRGKKVDVYEKGSRVTIYPIAERGMLSVVPPKNARSIITTEGCTSFFFNGISYAIYNDPKI